MAAAGLDKNRSEKFQRLQFAIQLNETLAVKDQIYLGMLFVVVWLRIFRDLDDMQRSRLVLRTDKGPLGKAAGTIHHIHFVEICYHIICHLSPHSPSLI